MIKDSGSRTEFETGAVRDIQEGKGRCDLMPLDVVAGYLTLEGLPNGVIAAIERYKQFNDHLELYRALDEFNEQHWKNNKTMILEVSKHFEEGAKKYGEYNWQKGIPESSYIDSALRHYLKWLRGDADERHDRAFVWNIMCLIWTHIHTESRGIGLFELVPVSRLEPHGKCVETSCYYNNDCTCTAPPAALVDETAGKECPQYSED